VCVYVTYVLCYRPESFILFELVASHLYIFPRTSDPTLALWSGNRKRVYNVVSRFTRHPPLIPNSLRTKDIYHIPFSRCYFY
jgi:hypothetical protein